MKNVKYLILNSIVLLLAAYTICFAQAPGKMNYQAVLRDASGEILKNSHVTLNILILQGSPSGSAVFSETHSTSTNAFGLADLEIGSEDPTGFAGIDWADGPYYVKIRVNGTEMGTSQLLSVPYALYARDVENAEDDDADPENELQILTIRSDTIFLSNGGYVKLPPSSGFSGDYNDLTNKPDINTSPNVLVGPGAGDYTPAGKKVVAIGDSALMNNGNGATEYYQARYNTAIGSKALLSNTTGYYNTATGRQALYSNTTGYANSAYGSQTLYLNTTGHSNTANGFRSLYSNTSGIYNTATGIYALQDNTSGNYNSAFGSAALSSNITGTYNTACGTSTLHNNSHGNFNTANGYEALLMNTGSGNTASGYLALYSNTKGEDNTANGRSALGSNTFGNRNTAIGFAALYYNTTGNINTAVGSNAGPTHPDLTNTGAFGYNARVSESNAIVIGNVEITSIGGYTTWSNISDKRFKTNINENVPGLAFIMKLKPVTYQLDLHKLGAFNGIPDSIYSQDQNMEKARQEKETRIITGFVAQDVEQAAKECNYDFSAVVKPENEKSQYRLSYAQFVVPMVKAIQEQQAIIEDLKARIETLEDHHNSKTSEDAH